MYSYDQIV